MPHAGPRAPVDMNPNNPIGHGRLPQLYNPDWRGLAAPIQGRYDEQATQDTQANHSSNSEWSKENPTGQWTWKSNPLGAFFYPKRYEAYQASLQPQSNHSRTRNGPAPIPLGGPAPIPLGGQTVPMLGGPAPLGGQAVNMLGGPELAQALRQSQGPPGGQALRQSKAPPGGQAVTMLGGPELAQALRQSQGPLDNVFGGLLRGANTLENRTRGKWRR